MPAMGGWENNKLVGAASAANESSFYSRLKPLPQYSK